MGFTIVRSDITEMQVDAVVCSTNSRLVGDAGVAKEIHTKGGILLSLECASIGHCPVGDAVITNGYNLNAKYVIHTVGPIYGWRGGSGRKLLMSCYERCLQLAMENDCHSIAIPLISTGSRKYPKYKAIRLADYVINDFLFDNFSYDLEVFLVVYDEESYHTSLELYNEVYDYIKETLEKGDYVMSCRFDNEELKKLIAKKPDTSFSKELLKLIDESGMDDATCYKRAHVDRKHFSKIRNNVHYHPSKQTALSFCVALRLNIEKTNKLLEKAGYSLNENDIGDIIVEYFIKHKKYNIFEINEYLYAYDQKLLGCN